MAFTEFEPALLGYVTGLVVGEPDLWVCEHSHRTWANQGSNAADIKRAAAQV
ncbi:hypothetical protein L0U85_01600 [Glycomyces sp. L485]|uniref:hypothetical protein n=1 Tax=Glycomyces sp. L485 TaxID=2909235 RepID=UPI001F4AAF7D|nr:hypothetical protein [Glycomyces sp. L485]MCH7229562.1 hypothetical protein [Glycomyces sp. L485]